MKEEAVTRFTKEESQMIHQLNMSGYGIAQGTDKIIEIEKDLIDTETLKLKMNQILDWWELLSKHKETFIKLKKEIDNK